MITRRKPLLSKNNMAAHLRFTKYLNKPKDSWNKVLQKAKTKHSSQAFSTIASHQHSAVKTCCHIVLKLKHQY